MDTSQNTQPPSLSVDAAHVKSEEMPEHSVAVKGYDFNEGVDYHKMFLSYNTIGFQALHLGTAIEEVKRMIEARKKPITDEKKFIDEHCRPKTSCTIFLSYTSNMISCGIREVIRFLVQHKMVDCLVTTGGGIEEDLIKCTNNFYIGDFKLKGSYLRARGLNRTGNLIVPNNNYCDFEDWLMPILDKMLEEQKELGTNWTPSKMIRRFGKEINHPESVYYWAYKNDIPVFCPALTDGAVGDNIYFHSFKNPGLRLDIAEDIRRINDLAVHSISTGMIILGGGIVKHHTCNANLMRNGADYSVYINTGQEFDGSDSGASPDEAVSWGKIKLDSRPVKVVADASLVFPILVAETFAREHHNQKEMNGN